MLIFNEFKSKLNGEDTCKGVTYRVNSGQSYKTFTIVNYDSRINTPYYEPRVVIYKCECFIRLAKEGLTLRARLRFCMKVVSDLIIFYKKN